jgi:hypothetical protein
MNEDRFTRLEELMEDTHSKVTLTHTTLFGAEGQGGVLRDVADLKRHKEEMGLFKAKLLGMALAASALISLVFAAIAKAIEWATKTNSH